MKNIILPIDFSDTTDILVEGAVDFAKNSRKNLFNTRSSCRYRFCYRRYGISIFPRDRKKSEISEELAELNEIEKNKSKGVACEHLLKQGSLLKLF